MLLIFQWLILILVAIRSNRKVSCKLVPQIGTNYQVQGKETLVEYVQTCCEKKHFLQDLKMEYYYYQ